MFAIDSSFVHVASPAGGILHLWQSINALAVKVPGMPLEPATGYIVLWRAADGNAAVCYLHYKSLNKSVTYTRMPKRFEVGEAEEVLAEAREFLESMGFMMDDANFANRPDGEKAALMARIPVFHADLALFERSRELDQGSDAQFVGDGEVAETSEGPELVLDEVVTAPAVAAATATAAASLAADPSRAKKVGRLLMSF